MNYIPERGDIVWLNFDPQAGHEQAGRRPALVISPFNYNKKVGLAICCPVTNQEKGYPFEVKLPKNLKAKGVILADQVKNLDWQQREVKFLCKVPEEILEEVFEKIETLIS
jgi:mRNA interferase MazF